MGRSPQGSVLVTGARGFVGQGVLRALRAAAVPVLATTRGPVPAGDSPAVAWRQVDLTSIGAVRALFAAERPVQVIHLSSMADGRRDPALAPVMVQAETVAAVNMLTAATESGTARIVLTASVEEPEPGEPPLSPYGAAKAATHLYARMFHRLYGTPLVMARIFMAYGPGQPEWKLIPSTIARLRAAESPVIESPARAADWIYIDDVAAAFLSILAAPAIEGAVIDVGSGRLTTVGALVEHLRERIAPAVQAHYGAGMDRGETTVRVADLAATGRRTGWSPRVGLEEGLDRTIAAMQ